MDEYPVTYWTRIGAIARARRRAQGITQQELAPQAGVSRGWLVRLERGHPNAEPSAVVRVLRALDLELVARPVRRTELDVLAEAALDEMLNSS